MGVSSEPVKVNSMGQVARSDTERSSVFQRNLPKITFKKY